MNEHFVLMTGKIRPQDVSSFECKMTFIKNYFT